MEKVKIFARDNEYKHVNVLVMDILRPLGQFSSFEDLIGKTIEYVDYDECGGVILTLE